MKRLKLSRWAAVLLAITLVPSAASAQEADTLSVSGTYLAEGLEYPGIIGADLAEVLANGNEHGWTLTLYGVTYSHDYEYQEWNDDWSYGFSERYITRVHATSFDFQFVGPDADVLNEVVSRQLVSGGRPNAACLELWNGNYFDSNFPYESGPYSTFVIELWPQDPAAGLSFLVQGYWNPGVLFSTDEFGYPLVEPQRVEAYFSTIYDYRAGNEGGLNSFDDLVDIGSSEPPVLPPPPPPPPALSIADGSMREGNKGTTRLNLTVTLSGSMTGAVSVNYATANSTALAKQDYTATSGTLTIPPGQTQGTISIAIKGDRKREPHETFSVQLSSAVGATINDGVATGTILNDD
jgi:hypothetical protein